MACVTFCGTEVVVACDAANVNNGSEWTIECSMETYDISDGWDNATNEDWKVFCAGMKEWGGSWRGAPSCSADCEMMCADAIGAECSATFTMESGCTIAGTIIITGVTINAVYRRQSEYTVTFKGVGAPLCPGDTPPV